MAGFLCPFCNQIMSISSSTQATRSPSFSGGHDPYGDSAFELTIHQCPSCFEITASIQGVGSSVEDVHPIQIRPNSLAKQFPDYVPESIRSDYEEACAIVNLSPKASATLSRRCLQNMIRDFWKISEKTLFNEIKALEGKVPAPQWKVIDSLRRIGNIGAHPEADVNLIIDIDPQDAQKLIQVIELLIKQWYIDRYDQEQLFSEVLVLDEEKQEKRHPKE